jgi:hypothetical protein
MSCETIRVRVDLFAQLIEHGEVEARHVSPVSARGDHSSATVWLAADDRLP